METRKRVLGSEHPDTLTSINNLVKGPKPQWRGHFTNGKMLPAAKTRPWPSTPVDYIIVRSFKGVAGGEQRDKCIKGFDLHIICL